MARIVGVHGINHEFSGSHSVRSKWLPALKDGLERVGTQLDSDDDFLCGFYGDVFRGSPRAIGVPNYTARDITSSWEKELLMQWWSEAAKVDQDVKGPEDTDDYRLAVPGGIQQALRALSRCKYLGGAAEKVIIFWIKQVQKYLHDPAIKDKIKKRIVDCIQDDTRVLIGHSLGSIVCYECLCEHPEWPVKVFVSLGSPLGIQRLIFEHLDPPPMNGMGQWPGEGRSWFNIADRGDIVALEKNLNPYFDGEVVDQLVDNGWDAHPAVRYLTAAETGAAIKKGLTD